MVATIGKNIILIPGPILGQVEGSFGLIDAFVMIALMLRLTRQPTNTPKIRKVSDNLFSFLSIYFLCITLELSGFTERRSRGVKSAGANC